MRERGAVYIFQQHITTTAVDESSEAAVWRDSGEKGPLIQQTGDDDSKQQDRNAAERVRQMPSKAQSAKVQHLVTE